jgi:hypothetical protein
LQNILKGINRADRKKTLERLAALKQEKKAVKALFK